MKKFIYAIIIALLGFNAGYAYSQPSKVVKHITNRIDSVSVSSIADSLNSILNDTIKFVSEDDKNQVIDSMNNAGVDIVVRSEVDTTRAEMNMINVTVISSFVFILLIIVTALIFGYMRRRAKYKLIEKAIENNYPLPEYLFNKNSAEQWGSLKSGIIYVAVGLGLMFAFDDSFMTGVFLVILIIGIGKIAVYALNKREDNKSDIKPPVLPVVTVPPAPPVLKNSAEPDKSVNSNNEPDNVK